MKRQAAFEKNGNKLLKGALHCHTTRSDGQGTPEEVIAKHADHGYDFMALTDHRVYNRKNFGDRPMTILPAMEMDCNFPEAFAGGIHCHHIVCLGAEEGGYAQDQRFESLRIQKPEDTQPLLDELHADGNMTLYCHPEWSGTPASEFSMLRGNFAMEIWNSGCAIENDLDTNAAYWDELLAQGQRLWGAATDDGHAMDQHCRGWVRVNAQKNVNDILRALREGAFYASTGPEIYDFYIDDNKVAHVKCSPCATVKFFCSRVTKLLRREDGSPITEMAMECPVRDDLFYLRVEVTDADGHVAWSNPIFLEEMK